MISFDYLAAPGQLGNQMFKYAALRGIAENNGYDFYVPPSKLYLEKNKQLNKAYRKIFKYEYQNHFLFEYFEMNSFPRKNIKYSKFTKQVSPESHLFDENLFNNCPDNVQLTGYYQSPKYFQNIEEIIRNDFKFKKHIVNKAKNLHFKYTFDCSMHIRRGDYLTNPNHYALSMKYYNQAIDIFGQDSNFLVFTDDIEWFKSTKFYRKGQFNLISTLTKNSTILDLYFMSLCNRHIIANSTFSWWGAWLSGSNKIIYPINWFKDGRSSSDIACSSWIGI